MLYRDAGGNKVSKPTHTNVSMENHSTWSGDATRNKSYEFGNTQGITINFGSDDSAKKEHHEKKEQPIWMVESTIKAEAKDVSTNKFFIFAFDYPGSKCSLSNINGNAVMTESPH